MFKNLAVSDDRRDRTSEVQHISDILPLVLARYEMHETQIIPRVEFKPSHIMPSHCVLASETGSSLFEWRAIFFEQGSK